MVRTVTIRLSLLIEKHHGATESLSDPDIQASRCHGEHCRFGVVDSEPEVAAVHQTEEACRRPRERPVPIRQGMVSCELRVSSSGRGIPVDTTPAFRASSLARRSRRRDLAPRAGACAKTSRISSSAVPGSRWAVGSSRMRTGASTSTAEALHADGTPHIATSDPAWLPLVLGVGRRGRRPAPSTARSSGDPLLAPASLLRPRPPSSRRGRGRARRPWRRLRSSPPALRRRRRVRHVLA